MPRSYIYSLHKSWYNLPPPEILILKGVSFLLTGLIFVIVWWSDTSLYQEHLYQMEVQNQKHSNISVVDIIISHSQDAAGHVKDKLIPELQHAGFKVGYEQCHVSIKDPSSLKRIKSPILIIVCSYDSSTKQLCIDKSQKAISRNFQKENTEMWSEESILVWSLHGCDLPYETLSLVKTMEWRNNRSKDSKKRVYLQLVEWVRVAISSTLIHKR